MLCTRSIVLACVCAGLIVGGAGCGCGKKPAAERSGDPTIATVDGREILASDLVDEYLKVPKEHQAQYEKDPQGLLDFIINRYVIVAEAHKQGVHTEPEVLERIEEARGFALRMALDQELLRGCEPATNQGRAREQLEKVRAAAIESARAAATIETSALRWTNDAADTEVVATVDDTTLTVANARRTFELLPTREQAACRADPARLVDVLVNNELLTREALRRGLDKSPEFDLRMVRARDMVLVSEMRRRALEQIKTGLSDEEIRRLAAEGAGGELPEELIVLYAILNANRPMIEKAVAELDAGKPFSEVHAACSAEKNPDFGTYSDITIRTAPEAIRSAIAGIEDGQHTDVLEIDGQYAVLQVTRRSTVVDLEPFREQIFARQRDALFLDWVLRKRAEHKVEVNTTNLDAVKLAGNAMSPAPTREGS
ncbi:MAG: hypothetical protein JW889_04070 [Verrucomicrobia bacterium]|nr:hypothetical protein [Verrucomicrobiota bacterium]